MTNLPLGKFNDKELKKFDFRTTPIGVPKDIEDDPSKGLNKLYESTKDVLGSDTPAKPKTRRKK